MGGRASREPLPAWEELLRMRPPEERNRMNLKTKVVATVLVFTIVGFLLNPETPLGSAVFGHPAEESSGAPPPSWAIPALIVVGLVQSLAFGAGFAFLFFGRPSVARLGETSGLATAAWLTMVWSLVSWVPHTAMHMTAGPDLGKLVVVEYLFHVTLILGAALLALFLVRVAEARAPRPAHAPVAAAQALAAQPTPVVLRRVVGQGQQGGQR